jgi:hypothetical protein
MYVSANEKAVSLNLHRYSEGAALCRVLRLDTMIKVREVCDEAEVGGCTT